MAGEALPAAGEDDKAAGDGRRGGGDEADAAANEQEREREGSLKESGGVVPGVKRTRNDSSTGDICHVQKPRVSFSTPSSVFTSSLSGCLTCHHRHRFVEFIAGFG